MTTDGLDDAVDELLVLWPALPTALPRDAGVQSGERVTTSENVHSVPLNVDVAATLLDLRRAIPGWTLWAGTAANLAAGASTVQACLRLLPGIHHRLGELGRTRDAQRLAETVHGWLGACRRALGLDRPDRAIGEMCPRHDDPLSPLVQPGDHGRLRYALLDRHGHPIDAYIEWSRIEIVCCRHCDAMWTPERYIHLGRLIRQATRDREQADAEADAEADDAA